MFEAPTPRATAETRLPEAGHERNTHRGKQSRPAATCEGNTPTPGAVPARVLVVHVVPLARLGLVELFRRDGRFICCGQTATAAEARELLAGHEPELLVTGLTLDGGDGAQLIREARKLSPRTRALVLTARADAASIQRGFRAGASAYVALEDAATTVLEGLGEVMRGELFVSPAVARLAVQTLAIANTRGDEALNRLSDREWLIFRRLGARDGPAAIARKLNVSIKTVETHQARMKEKLGCRTAADLHVKASRWALRALRHHHG